MPPFPVNLAALAAAEAAAGTPSKMRTYVADVRRLRAWTAKELCALGVKTYPSAGNFLLANFGPTGPDLVRKLERQGILLRDRSKDMGSGFVRITIGTSAEMQRLLKLVRKEWKATRRNGATTE
jgi:histidinol-phosphate aminotransferase